MRLLFVRGKSVGRDARPEKKFIFVGNQPCLDFINTAVVLDGEPRDLLATSSDVLAWAVQAKVLTQAEADGLERQSGKQGQAGMLEEVRAFRAVLRDMVERIAARKPVPQTAVRPTERGFLCFVIEDGVAKERLVDLGLRTTDGLVAVRKGLSAGEKLVVRGAEALRDGANVTVSEGPAPSTSGS